MIGECMNPNVKGCKFNKSVGHHLYYPKRDYESPLEKAFRELPVNKVQICACAEWLIHNTLPDPIKPNLMEMIGALTVKLEDES